MNGTKALGGWNESGAFRNCYDRAFPVDALLGAAAFSARHPEQYSLPRGSLEPPGDLLRQLFPWVEGQQAALSTRSQDARCKDIALRQFLSVLVWFRVVILQDAAVLYSQHPHLSFFTFRPFNSPAFHDFAASSAATIAHAESKARLAYENMPEHLIAGLRGTYADLRMEQRKEQENNARQLGDLRQQYSQLEGLLMQLVESKPKGRKGKGMCLFFCVSSCANLLCTAALPAIEIPTLLLPPPAPPSFPMPNTATTQPSLPHFPCGSLSSAVIPPQLLSSPTQIRCELPSSGMHSSAPAAAQHVDAITTSKHLKWATITEKFGIERTSMHQWDWEDGDYLPCYEYQTVTSITDVWTEWASGLNGYIPVRDLMERWGAKWRRNLPRRKTEGVRRKAIVDLIEELVMKPRWEVPLALRFLREKYEPTFKPRAFSEHLTKNQRAGFKAVLQSSQTYPS